MTPPPSSSIPRRPALPLLNLQGRHVPVLEPYDASSSASQLRSLARLADSFDSNRTSRISQSYARLLLFDVGGQGASFTEHSPSDIEQLLNGLRTRLEESNNGDIQSMFRAMNGFFALTHRMLENAEARAEVPAVLGQFRSFARQVMGFIVNNPDLSPEQKFQYLYRASTVVGLVLGRTRSNEESQQATASEEQPLKDLLGEFFVAALAQHRQYMLAHPNGESYTPIVREIQMRQAILANDQPAARQRARELLRHLVEHPPGEADPNHPETRRWDLEAARQLQNDPTFTTLVNGLDSPTRAESASALLNGVSQEILATVCSGIDMVNGDSEAVILARYRPMSSVIAVMSLTRPSMTLEELVTALADSGQQAAIQAEIEAAAAQSSSLNESLTTARGDNSLTQWIQQARVAADHVVRLRAGAGSRLLTGLFQSNRRHNPIVDLAENLRTHPQLLIQLGLTPAEIGQPEHEIRAALELYRRGSLGIAMVQTYHDQHSLSVSGILALLQEEHLANAQVNSTVSAVIEYYSRNVDGSPDHEISALHGVFRVLGETSEIGGGVTLDSRLTNHSREIALRMESTGFRWGRAWHHVTAPSSLGTMAVGLVLSELAPAALIYRAGAAGSLVRAGVPLVRAGTVTWQGTVLTGFGTGMAMSAIGSGLQNYERASYGLHTDFWGDFGHGTVVNGVTFAGTMLLSQGLSRAFAPRSTAQALGSGNWLRRFGLFSATAIGGTAIAMGANAGVRWYQSGHLTAPTFEEVAENALTLLMWETGSAGLRSFRRRYALRAELEGRRPFEPIQLDLTTGRPIEAEVAPNSEANVARESAPTVETTPATGETVPTSTERTANPSPVNAEAAAPAQAAAEPQTFLQRLRARIEGLGPLRWRPLIGNSAPAWVVRNRARAHNLMGRINAGILNPFFTVLGEYRANLVREHARAIVGRNPQLAPLEDAIAHRIASEEAIYPGSIEQYNDQFLRNYQVQISGDMANPTLQFVRGGSAIPAPEGYTAGVINGLRDNLRSCTPNDPDYLPRYLPNAGHQMVQIRIDPNPRNPRIVGIGSHTFHAEVTDPIVVTGSYDPQTRTLRLPPLHGETTMQSIDMGPMFDAHRTSPLPMAWGEAIGTNFLQQRTLQDRNNRVPLEQLIDAASNNAQINLPINADTGEILVGLLREQPRASDLPPAGTRILRLPAQLNKSERTLTLSAPRGQEGNYVINMENGRIEHILPETAQGGTPRDAAPRTPHRAAEVPSTPRLLELIQGRTLTAAQRAILRRPSAGGAESTPVTVYFSRVRGRILGISNNHQSARSLPFHRVAEHLNSGNEVPARRSWHGTLNAAENAITLRIPAEEGQAAGTMRIDLNSGEIRFEAEAAPASRTDPEAHVDSDVIELEDLDGPNPDDTGPGGSH